MSQGEQLYVVRRADAPWGDYGAVLYNGVIESLQIEPRQVTLSRTGPFIPPISFPGSGVTVVNDLGRRLLVSSMLSGLSFCKVKKKKIVFVPWEEWDRGDVTPKALAKMGDPEKVIRNSRHCPSTAEKPGDLWELVSGDGAHAVLIQDYPIEFALIIGSWNGLDFFSVPENNILYCSARAAAWLEATFAQWVKVKPVKMVP